MSKADDRIQEHLDKTGGVLRLITIRHGIKFEVNCPGMRLTAKAPKCSTILRREFGLSGKPEKLQKQFETLLEKHGVRP